MQVLYSQISVLTFIFLPLRDSQASCTSSQAFVMLHSHVCGGSCFLIRKTTWEPSAGVWLHLARLMLYGTANSIRKSRSREQTFLAADGRWLRKIIPHATRADGDRTLSGAEDSDEAPLEISEDADATHDVSNDDITDEMNSSSLC